VWFSDLSHIRHAINREKPHSQEWLCYFFRSLRSLRYQASSYEAATKIETIDPIFVFAFSIPGWAIT